MARFHRWTPNPGPVRSFADGVFTPLPDPDALTPEQEAQVQNAIRVLRWAGKKCGERVPAMRAEIERQLDENPEAAAAFEHWRRGGHGFRTE